MSFLTAFGIAATAYLFGVACGVPPDDDAPLAFAALLAFLLVACGVALVLPWD